MRQRLKNPSSQNNLSCLLQPIVELVYTCNPNGYVLLSSVVSFRIWSNHSNNAFSVVVFIRGGRPSPSSLGMAFFLVKDNFTPFLLCLLSKVVVCVAVVDCSLDCCCSTACTPLTLSTVPVLVISWYKYSTRVLVLINWYSRYKYSRVRVIVQVLEYRTRTRYEVLVLHYYHDEPVRRTVLVQVTDWREGTWYEYKFPPPLPPEQGHHEHWFYLQH
jgi:hypothetical protein